MMTRSTLQIFMDVPLNVVQERDPKGLYEKVAKGEIEHFTGVDKDSPYEPPLHAGQYADRWL